MTYYFTSDTHCGHSNIVSGISKWEPKDGCRQFSTLEEHDNTIIDNINSVVGENDILIHAGDFAFGGKDNIPKYRNFIRCKNIFLCKGNHDYKLWDYHRELFRETKLRFNLTFGKQLIVVDHYPLISWEEMGRGSYHLHGHCHQNLRFNNGSKMLDIGVEGHNYKPWSYNEIVEFMNSRQVISMDHHI